MRSSNRSNFEALETINIQGRNMYVLDNRIARFITDKKIYVLRDKKTGMALNASYTEDGLKWTTNNRGKLLYYENARLGSMINLKRSLEKGEPIVTNVYIESNDFSPLRKSNDVYVEQFVPTNQSTIKGQVAEYTWADKAYHLALLNAETFEA